MKARRRQLAIERTREDILVAAARAFGRSGYREATMRDIAREAGYTAASLYTYFPSKEEILKGFVTLINEEFRRTFEEPDPAGLTFAQRLELVVRRQLEQWERRRELISALFTSSPPPHRPGDACDPMSVRVKLFRAWLEKHARPADLGGQSAETAARLLLGITFAFLHRWLSAPESRSPSDRAALVVSLFLHGVSGGAARPRTPARRR